MRNGKDWKTWHRGSLDIDARPRCAYGACPQEEYAQLRTRWNGRAYTTYYRLAWRAMIDPKNTDVACRSAHSTWRSPCSCSAFPGPGKRPPDRRQRWLLGIFPPRLPSAGNRPHSPSSGRGLQMPAATTEHPLVHPLAPTHSPTQLPSPRLTPPSGLSSSIRRGPTTKRGRNPGTGQRDAPLSDSSPDIGVSTLRFAPTLSARAALVELDALVSVWLGITPTNSSLSIGPDTRVGRLRIRYLLRHRGRKIARDYYAYGHGQTKQDT